MSGSTGSASTTAKTTAPTSKPTIFLHVGEPKTGTTSLQRLMYASRDTLAAQGVLLPGSRPLAYWRAAQDLLEVAQVPNDPIGPFRGAWDSLAKQSLRAPRVAVVSHELLASATAAQARRAVESFGDADVHVVLSVRDFGSLLAAEWQETIKHRNTRTWERWLDDVIERESGRPDRDRFWFWKVHDTAAVLRRWGATLPAEHVHVLTMPPLEASPTLLWERFAGLLGVDPKSAGSTSIRANTSLGSADAEFLRRVNEALPDDLPDWFYQWHVKEALGHRTLGARKSQDRLVVPADRDEWVRKQADQVVADLGSSGYDIIGDLDELVPRPPEGRRVSPTDATADAMVVAGVDAVVTLIDELARAKNVDGRRPLEGDAEPSLASLIPSGAALKRRLIAYSEKNMWAHQMRRRYWRWANARATARNGNGG